MDKIQVGVDASSTQGITPASKMASAALTSAPAILQKRRTEKSGGVLNVFKQNHSDGKIFDVSRVGLIGSQPL
jgi:hypothetical protein